MIRTNTQLLQAISRLAASPASDWAIAERSVKAGKRLIWQGDSPKHVYCLIDGLAKCFITEENGQDFLLEFLGEGEIIGELEMLSQQHYMSNIEAITDLSFYQIPNPVFMQMLEELRDFNKLVLVELANRVSQTARRASYQQVYPLEYAVLKILYVFSENEQSISKKDMAAYLGISLRSLNRILKKLRENGIIQADDQTLIISSSARLLQAMEAFH